jgi:glyoxylase-like metal-dependent hydrolase (beta-lactamase superfamily II)
MVAANIRARGVALGEVKLILVTHAHFDHVGAVAKLQRLTGAKVLAGQRDVDALEHGTPPGETSYAPVPFPAVHVDVGVTDGRVLRLGDTLVKAIATPGHTPGCTSWLTRVPGDAKQGGRPLMVFFPCSVTVAGNRLVGNRRYPTIVADFRLSFQRLARVRPDVVLPAHPEIADVLGRARAGTLVDRTLWPRLLRKSVADFDAELARQEKRP